jgi:cysteine desulfurase / selenocysteine lyase
MSYDVAALRRDEFPWADRRIFLNHASTGPLPERARRAVEAFNRERTEGCAISDARLQAILARARETAARLVGGHPTEIALATNTSYGLNLAALMLPLDSGDVVVASHGEFPANVVPWRALERRGIGFELLPRTPEGWPDEARLLERMGDPRVRVVAVSSVQFQSGYAVDLERLAARADATGTFLVVDAIQSLGQRPFDVRRTPAAVVSAGAQKWLLSPWGTGFAWVRPDLVRSLEPPFAGWMAFAGTEDFSRLTDYPRAWHDDARRFEMITLPFQDFVGFNEAAGLLLELGPAEIERHLVTITEPVVAWADRRGIPLAAPASSRAPGMVCLVPPDAARVHQALAEAGVVASLREGGIRLSPHCYNTADEMQQVTDIVDRVLGGPALQRIR